MRARTLALLAALALVASLGGSAPGSAGSPAEPVSEFHLTDPAGDAYLDHGRPGSGRNVDLVATDIWRRADELVLQLTYADLVRPRNQQWSFAFWVYRSHRPKLFVEWGESQNETGRSRGGSISKVGTDAQQWIDCPGLQARRSYRTDILTFRLPAECFGDRASMVISGLHTNVNEWDRGGKDGEDSPFSDDSVPYDSETQPLVDPA